MSSDNIKMSTAPAGAPGGQPQQMMQLGGAPQPLPEAPDPLKRQPVSEKRVLQDRSILLSVIACIVGFGGFILWGFVAKLDEGVTASGQVVVQDDRKAVQHFEGGIISTLNVREGQTVAQGEVLLELAPVQSESARDELAQEYAMQSANFARLSALRQEADTISFAFLDKIKLPAQTKDDIVSRQLGLFYQQREARVAELSVLETRRSSLEQRQRDLTSQIRATRNALSVAREDLNLRRDMMNEGLETIGNVQRVEREVAGYEADLSRLVGDRNEAMKSVEEVDNQIIEARAKFQEAIGEQTVEAQARSLGARERLLALDDRLARTVIRAPQAGTVLNLAHSTVGGVVGPGELIMEIVPDTDDLIVSVRLTPTDRDAVTPGQGVEAQLSAYKSFEVPRLKGEVIGVSADIIQDEVSGAYYYEARVLLDASIIEPGSRVQIIPGMPVETFIKSGSKRSFVEMVFEPIITTFQRGTRMG